MERRCFIGTAGCGLAGLLAAPASLHGEQEKTQEKAPAPARPPRYRIDIEIFEARPDSWCHKKGDKFAYPEDLGKICPWLQGSMHDALILLRQGVTLPWLYEGTPYQKVIDANGVTTEFIRCPDPTANLVAKIIRTKIG